MGVVAKTSLTLRLGYLEFREQGFILFDLFYKESKSNCEKRAKESQEESRRFTDQTLKFKHLLHCVIVISKVKNVKMTVTFTILLEISFWLL